MINQAGHLLKPYASVFTKPQYSHFQHMITCLSACDKPSIRRYAELHTKSRSSLSRFLTNSPWKPKDVKSVYHKQLKKVIDNNSYLILDDTLSHRPYAKKVEKANSHFDHTTNGYSLGYSVLTSVIYTNKEVIPYDLECYYRKDDCDDSTFRSKVDIAAEIIKSTKDNKKIKIVLFDSWYSNRIVIDACKEASKHYITMIKSDRNVTYEHRKRKVKEWGLRREFYIWNEFKFNGFKLRYQSIKAFHM
jgi:hypothetical protein